LDSRALAQFETYLALLLKWNSRLNLTAIRGSAEIIQRHFMESIFCAQAIPTLPIGARLLDFGSGGGLPGIPIAICRPEIRVTLAESQRKKVAFLREAVRSLNLPVEVFDGRVEEMPQSENFSVVTLRAVERMPTACRAAASRLSQGGLMMAFSTEDRAGSLKAAVSELEPWSELRIPGLNQGLLLLGQRPL
jgi:16S rRNA (guanine527-N7)-methyltransferase